MNLLLPLLLLLPAVVNSQVPENVTYQQQAVFTWNTPQARQDTSILEPSELSHYTIYLDIPNQPQQTFRVTSSPINVPNQPTTTNTATVDFDITVTKAQALSTGAVLLDAWITATDNYDNTSENSKIASTTTDIPNRVIEQFIPDSPPLPATDFKIQVTDSNRAVRVFDPN